MGIRTLTYIYSHTDLNIGHPLPVSMVHITQVRTVIHSTFMNQFKKAPKSQKYTNFKESFESDDYYTSTTSHSHIKRRNFEELDAQMTMGSPQSS